jgi:lactate dehydrogenase-like 2-hydroxyacid dehydrogenase
VKVLQIVRLPVPPDYSRPEDLPVVEAFDVGQIKASDDVEVLVTHSVVGVPARLWDALPNLKLVANFGVGLDRIDLTEARRRGVRVTYTPHQLTADVADLAITLSAALLRRLPAADAFVRNGGWSSGPFGLGRSVTGRKLGILGLGRIGLAISARARGFDMEVAYMSRSAKPASGLRRFETAMELAVWSDILVAALPGGEKTNKIVDAAVLDALGPEGLFINVARPSVVDETALIAALKTNAICGAGLEIFDAGSLLVPALKNADNVILTPHIGSATRDTRIAMAEAVFENVRAFLSGGMLRDDVV